MPCLICGREPTDKHHWPQAVGMGRNRKRVDLSTVPLCRTCHTKMHAGDRGVTERVAERAPDWWRAVGEWERAEPYYLRWLERREYLEAVR